MENPDLVLQETGSRPTYSRLNYVPSGDTLRLDAISSFSLLINAVILLLNYLVLILNLYMHYLSFRIIFSI